MSHTTEAPNDPDHPTSTDVLADSSMADALEPETGIVWERFGILLLILLMLLFLGGLNMLVFVGALASALVIHEAGHYFVARWSGMKVTEFFIGFGPRIFSFKRGETTYGLKVAVPLGAYVRIIGMNNLDPVDEGDEPRAYRSAPWHKRVLTILAGPATHFVVAMILMTALLWQDGFPITGDPDDPGVGPWTVGFVVPFSAANDAGLQPRDRIISIDGVETDEFNDLTAIIPNVHGDVVNIEFERDFAPQSAQVRIGERLTESGAAGYDGLETGDLLLAFAGEPVTNYDHFARLASERIGDQVPVNVVYFGEEHVESVTIKAVATDDAVEGFLGIARGSGYEAPRSFGASLVAAPGKVGGVIKEIGSRTPELVTTSEGRRGLFGLSWIAGDSDEAAPEVAARQPRAAVDEYRPISLIGATRIADQLEDPYQVVFLLIALNLFFGLFNLLPLLPLDGGHIVLATYERIRSFGREKYAADAAKLLPLTYAVVALVMFVGGIAILRDIFDPINF